MGSRLSSLITGIGFLCLGVPTGALAQSVTNYAVEASATISTNPPQVTLVWPADPLNSGYTVSRKLISDTAWGAGTNLPSSATSYVDTNVALGGAYEYYILKDGLGYSGYGYVCAGIQAPLVSSRGIADLMVDETMTANLALELTRLQQDLVGDGWVVIRHDVPRAVVDPANTASNVWAARSNELAGIKNLILADYAANSTNLKAVFLFGHLPVPYSGNLSPDNHSDHVGAWPADGYYADMSGLWSDSSVNDTSASSTRNWNVPGDGKLDPYEFPATLQLEVGRVDLYNLPAFPKSETELLRQYPNKDHNFRQRLVTAARRGLVDDNFGVYGGEAFAADGWRNFAPFFGASNVVAGGWLTTLDTQSYLWGYGCGPGTYTNATGVCQTSDLVTNDPQVVFTMMFGSYFGDWDAQNDFLRAQLASATYTLTSAWAGRPYWQFHHMALGKEIGYSTRLTQNNIGLYAANLYQNYVHIGLMGDPMLRMHPVTPPSSLSIVTNGHGGMTLGWNASTQPVAGYSVYSASTSTGPFTQLTNSLVTTTNWTVSSVTTNVYMVRAVNLELAGSGSYFNPSQGIIQNLAGTAGMPQIELLAPTNNSLFTIPAGVLLSATLFDPANSVTNITFYANGAAIGQASLPTPTLTWSNMPPGIYTVTAGAIGNGTVVNLSSPATILVVGASPVLSLKSAGPGSNTISGIAIPGSTNRILASPTPNGTNWVTIGSVTTSPAGTFQFLGTNAVPQQFYRTVFP